LVNGENIAIDSVFFKTNSSYDLVLITGQQLKSVDVVQVSYSGTSMKSETAVAIAPFTKVRAINDSPLFYQLPGTVQAENYVVNSGLSVETCSDTGGGQDMGFTNTGDYMDYLVYVPYNGTFSFDYRVASPKGGSLDLRLIDNPSKPITLHTVTVPNTGGWQTWRTVSASADLTKGTHTLRIFIRQPEFNINWMKASLITGVINFDENKKIRVYPNPAYDQLNVEAIGLSGNSVIRIISMQGNVLKQLTVSLSANQNIPIDISNLAEGFYILLVENNHETHQSRIVKLNSK